MPDDGRVLGLAALAPEVDTLDLSVLNSLAGGENLRVLGERFLQVIEELGVLFEAVVGLEVGLVGVRNLLTSMSASSYGVLACGNFH